MMTVNMRPGALAVVNPITQVPVFMNPTELRDSRLLQPNTLVLVLAVAAFRTGASKHINVWTLVTGAGKLGWTHWGLREV